MRPDTAGVPHFVVLLEEEVVGGGEEEVGLTQDGVDPGGGEGGGCVQVEWGCLEESAEFGEGVGLGLIMSVVLCKLSSGEEYLEEWRNKTMKLSIRRW